MKAAPFKVGSMPFLLIRLGLPPKVGHLSTKPTSFARLYLESQQLSDNMQLNTLSLIRLGRGLDKTMEFDDVSTQYKF